MPFLFINGRRVSLWVSYIENKDTQIKLQQLWLLFKDSSMCWDWLQELLWLAMEILLWHFLWVFRQELFCIFLWPKCYFSKFRLWTRKNYSQCFLLIYLLGCLLGYKDFRNQWLLSHNDFRLEKIDIFCFK